MTRETRELNIDGNQFIIKTYASAREANAIQSAYFKGAKVEVVGDQPKISEFNPSVQIEVQKEMVNQLVISVNGTTEGIVDHCLDLPSDAYAELVRILDTEVISKKK